MIKHGLATKHWLYILLASLVLFFICVQALSAKEPSKLRRESLFGKEVELPSNKVHANIVRVTFPPSFETPWHEHKGPGPRYILKGQLKVTEGGVTKTYSAGDVFWESGQRMQVENVGEGEAQLVIFELAPVR
ncbi:MAG: cupin domain-containing protein [Gammaproteobacteria bacterium]